MFEQSHNLANRFSLFRLNRNLGKRTRSNSRMPTSSSAHSINSTAARRIGSFLCRSLARTWPKFLGIAKVNLEAFRGDATSDRASRFGDRSIVGWRRYPPKFLEVNQLSCQRGQAGITLRKMMATSSHTTMTRTRESPNFSSSMPYSQQYSTP